MVKYVIVITNQSSRGDCCVDNLHLITVYTGRYANERTKECSVDVNNWIHVGQVIKCRQCLPSERVYIVVATSSKSYTLQTDVTQLA